MSSPSANDAFDDITASTTSELPIQITNSISLAACVMVVVSYFLFRRKNSRLMNRPSLLIAMSISGSDLLLHCVNLVGYSNLPHNFICSFFGGFLYAFPTMLSIFLSLSIALNTQLVFVFSKRPGGSTLKYYLGIPILLALCICVPALGAGVYGYDESFGYCWYATKQMTQKKIVIRYIFTFALWCLGSIFYLIIAALTIINAVFSKTSKLTHLTTNISSAQRVDSPSFLPDIRDGSKYLGTRSQLDSSPVGTPIAREIPRISRRSLAMRALAFRLLGYILIPTICVCPGIIKDLISKVQPAAVEKLPEWANAIFDSLNGLVGLFNAILFACDPALLALYHQFGKGQNHEQGQGENVELAAHGSENTPNEAVEVKKGRFLRPIFTGSRSPSSSGPGGIMIRVEVQVERDDELDRLGHYLDGM